MVVGVIVAAVVDAAGVPAEVATVGVVVAGAVAMSPPMGF
jgi:hypothetical protein